MCRYGFFFRATASGFFEDKESVITHEIKKNGRG
jgi:hypothetical protein